LSKQKKGNEMKKYTVKKYEKGQEIARLGLKEGELVFRTKKVEWAVIDENGSPVMSQNAVSNQIQFEIFSTKRTAQMQADWMNENV
jgi:hypothetical protein